MGSWGKRGDTHEKGTVIFFLHGRGRLMELGYAKNSEDSLKGPYISHSYPGETAGQDPI
jgi:hypothetical protein